MMDLASLAVSPHELDAWLRSTDVDDPKKTEETPTAPNKANKRGDRRSSLDCASGSDLVSEFFGIDARTMLMAESGPPGDNRRGEAYWRLVSSESLDRRDRGEADVRLMSNKSLDYAKEEDCASPLPRPRPKFLSRMDRAKVPPAMPSACARASSFSSNMTCASGETIPRRNHDLRRTVSDHGRADPARISPVREEEPPVRHFPGNDGHARRSSSSCDDIHHGRPVSPIPPIDPEPIERGRGHSDTVGGGLTTSPPGLSRLVKAMKLSKDSHDCLGRRFSESTSRRGMLTMRETAKSRRTLLRALLRSTAEHRVHRGANTPCAIHNVARRCCLIPTRAPQATIEKAGRGRCWRPTLEQVRDFRSSGRCPPKPVHVPAHSRTRPAPKDCLLRDVRAELHRIALEQMVEMRMEGRPIY